MCLDGRTFLITRSDYFEPFLEVNKTGGYRPMGRAGPMPKPRLTHWPRPRLGDSFHLDRAERESLRLEVVRINMHRGFQFLW